MFHPDEFPIGIIITAIRSDHSYHISVGKCYEVSEVIELSDGDFNITFINDICSMSSKSVNSFGYPFSDYFKIL